MIAKSYEKVLNSVALLRLASDQLHVEDIISECVVRARLVNCCMIAIFPLAMINELAYLACE